MSVAAHLRSGFEPRTTTAQQRHHAKQAHFLRLSVSYGGLCEAPSREAGTVAGSSNLVQPATIASNSDAGGLQPFNGDCYV